MSTPNTSSKLDDIDVISLLAETGLTPNQVANAIMKAVELVNLQSTAAQLDNTVNNAATKTEVSALNVPTNTQMSILVKLAGLLSTGSEINTAVTDIATLKLKTGGVEKTDLDLLGLLAETGLTAAQVADAIKKSKELSKTSTEINEALTKLDSVTKAQIDAAVANPGFTVPGLTTTQMQLAVKKSSDTVSTATQIDNMVTNGATKAELNAAVIAGGGTVTSSGSFTKTFVVGDWVGTTTKTLTIPQTTHLLGVGYKDVTIFDATDIATTVGYSVDDTTGNVTLTTTGTAFAGSAFIVGGASSGGGTSLTTEQTDAIEKIKGLEVSASEIDGAVKGNNAYNRYSLHFFDDALQSLDEEGVNNHFSVCGYGDSMANGYMTDFLFRGLQKRYGIGGVMTPNLGQDAFDGVITYLSGASKPSTDYTYLPGSNQINMPIGSSIEYTSKSFVRDASNTTSETKTAQSWAEYGLSPTSVRFLYITEPSAGTLTFSAEQSGVTYSGGSVDCNGTLGVSYIDVPLSGFGAVSITVSATVATSHFLGAVFYEKKGILRWKAQVGGSTMEQQKTYIDNGNDVAIFRPLAEALNTKLVFHTQRAGDDLNYEINYANVFNSIISHASMSQLVIGEAPRESETTPTVAQINDFLDKECSSKKIAYINLTKLFDGADNPMVNLYEWHENDVHFHGQAHRYMATKISNILGWDTYNVGSVYYDKPLTNKQFYTNMPRYKALMEAHSHTITINSSYVLDSEITDGDYSKTKNNDGLTLSAPTASIGYKAVKLGNIPHDYVLRPTKYNYAFTWTGNRGLKIKEGARALITIGASSTFAKIEEVNEKCFGVEFANRKDVNSSTYDVDTFRLFYFDGTSLVTSSWANGYETSFDQAGLFPLLEYNKDTNFLDLYMNQEDQLLYHACRLKMDTVLATTGRGITFGLSSNVIPTSAGSKIGVTNFISTWNAYSYKESSVSRLINE